MLEHCGITFSWGTEFGKGKPILDCFWQRTNFFITVLPRYFEVLKMWMSGLRQADVNKYTYETCGKGVEPEQPALKWVCERWEHVECVCRPDRIEERLYTALMTNLSKLLLFCCTTCQCKGCIVKQIYKLWSDFGSSERAAADQRARCGSGTSPHHSP